LGLKNDVTRNTSNKAVVVLVGMRHIIAWSILAIGLAITALMSFHSKSTVDQAIQREFAFTYNEIRINIVERLKGNAQILRSGAAFFNASHTVSRDEWRVFASALKLEVQYPGIQGIGFSLLIPAGLLEQHTREIRSEGFPEYSIRPAGERPVYSSIVYLEPFSGRNLRAFGYDMFSEQVRREAMERARDENAPALSGKVILVQETEQDVQFGALMYMPVYRRGEPIETIAQRRSAIQGWVYSPYRMADLMRGTLRDWEARLSGSKLVLQVYDGFKIDTENLLYDSRGDESNNADPLNPALMHMVPVEFAGHSWTLRFFQYGGLDINSRYRVVWLNALGGTIISILLFILMLSMLRIREDAGQLAVRLEENKNLLGELQHRAKNSFSMICSLISLSSQTGSSTESQEAFEELESRVRSVSELYSLLYASGSVSKVRLDDYCRQVSETLAGLAGRIVLHSSLEPVTVPTKTAAPIGLIVNELLTNAIKYAFPGDRPGAITMTLRDTGPALVLEVTDDGVGLPAGFNPAASRGMGLSLVHALAEQVGGDFTMESTKTGTRCSLRFPGGSSSNLVA